MIRAFFAIPIPSEAAKSIAAYRQQLLINENDPVEWVEPHYWHVTLRFFEQVSPGLLASIGRTLSAFVRGRAPFKYQIKKIGRFPNSYAPVIAALISPNDELKALVDVLDERAFQGGIPREHRRFRPHITLGKSVSKPQPLKPYVLDDVFIPVREIILYHSKPSDNGRAYLPLRTFTL